MDVAKYLASSILEQYLSVLHYSLHVAVQLSTLHSKPSRHLLFRSVFCRISKYYD